MLAIVPLLLLPVAATFGWFVGRKDKPQEKSTSSAQLRQNYFKGLNYLINEQPDKAVDVFIRLLEVDGDTVETHLALGNLFRRRGEVDRAIRVHQNLIARPQLDREYRLHALSALGQDYLKAGVLDRAEGLFLELVELGEEDESSLKFLLRIYQQEKDWVKAIEAAQKLEKKFGEPMRAIIAQYYCELAEQMLQQGKYNELQSYLKLAHVIDGNCVRASLIKGKVEQQAGRHKEAIRSYKRVKEQNPDFLPEIVEPIVACYQAINAEAKLVAYLQECLQDHPRISIVIAISDYLRREQGDKAAIEFIAHQIQDQPSLTCTNPQ